MLCRTGGKVWTARQQYSRPRRKAECHCTSSQRVRRCYLLSLRPSYYSVVSLPSRQFCPPEGAPHWEKWARLLHPSTLLLPPTTADALFHRYCSQHTSASFCPCDRGGWEKQRFLGRRLASCTWVARNATPSGERGPATTIRRSQGSGRTATQPLIIRLVRFVQWYVQRL